MMMMMIYSARLSLKGTSTIYMGSIPPVPPWSRDSPYVRFERFFVLAFDSTLQSGSYAGAMRGSTCFSA